MATIEVVVDGVLFPSIVAQPVNAKSETPRIVVNNLEDLAVKNGMCQLKPADPSLRVCRRSLIELLPPDMLR